MIAHRLSLSRLLPCLYWARGDVDCPDDPPGRPARIGTLVHRMAEERVTGVQFDRSKADLHELAEAMTIFAGPLTGWIDAWKASPGRHLAEVRLRYDAEDHRVFECPRRGEPGYVSPGPMQLTGEMDFVTILDDVADVIDLKTGQKRHTDPAQLRSYAVLAERKWNVKKVRVAFLYARKTKVDLEPWTEFDVDTLEAHAGKLLSTLRAVPTAEPIPGDHCYRCPLGKAKCPAFVSKAWAEDDSMRVYDESVRLF